MLCSNISNATTFKFVDERGIVRGYVTESSSGIQTLKDSSGNTIGYYYPNTNKTTDQYGTVIGYGNWLGYLLKK